VIYIALVQGFVLGIFATLYGATIRSLTRQQARERDLLLNQLYNAVGRPWQPAPSSEVKEDEPAELYLVAPEQAPDDFNWEE
jgi:hypothetical protein